MRIEVEVRGDENRIEAEGRGDENRSGEELR